MSWFCVFLFVWDFCLCLFVLGVVCLVLCFRSHLGHEFMNISSYSKVQNWYIFKIGWSLQSPVPIWSQLPRYPSHRPLLIEVFESSSLIISCISKEWEDICTYVKLGGIISFVLNRCHPANTRWGRTMNPVLAHSNVCSHILFEFPGPSLSPKKPPWSLSKLLKIWEGQDPPWL